MSKKLLVSRLAYKDLRPSMARANELTEIKIKTAIYMNFWLVIAIVLSVGWLLFKAVQIPDAGDVYVQYMSKPSVIQKIDYTSKETLGKPLPRLQVSAAEIDISIKIQPYLLAPGEESRQSNPISR